MPQAALTTDNHDRIIIRSFSILDALQAAAKPFVVGLLFVQPNIPEPISFALLAHLSKDVDLRETSPVVEAAMWLYEFGRMSPASLEHSECHARLDLLTSSQQLGNLEAAVLFIGQLADLIEAELVIAESMAV